VTVVEHLGNEVILYATSPEGVEFVARVAPRTAAAPDRHLSLSIEMAKMHAFDAETTLAIRERSARADRTAGEPAASV
jgi:multiple sugar transport system ATP-binding protein